MQPVFTYLDFKMSLRYRTMSSPIGSLTAIASDHGLTSILFASASVVQNAQAVHAGQHELLDAAIDQLTLYFARKLTQFKIQFDLQGTPFQQKVWQALQDIPYGETCSYATIAQNILQPKAYRAVGMANHYNPIPIMIPCHRVIGSKGQLTGFAGGLDIKKHLLSLEKSRIFKE